MDLRVAGLDHPDAVALNEQVQSYYREIYGDGDVTTLLREQFDAPRGIYLVGYDGVRPVASGAWRALEPDPVDPVDDVVRDGDAEIKRMYVVPDVRGKGHARAVLAELERTARAAGRRRMVLETGTRQPDAVALYVSSGYTSIGTFGVHRDDPRSRCFAKPLV
ncbi:GNAT family N-acetyltransferase [Pseudonocardia sp. KRD291]|uniref:GNAT family N-acetyltransferase n=1 Tax=Pseudonocardia sp. KRD291 TaxID=2792007 RepID=UPI001C49FA05|nr:GNAT family N-acetyltransferase [Pseudonocardia sp. KRD291]MBW0105646.1 GNAT family N-acetyltransferase [Pseudonocardia sp. KRD291]